MLVTDAGDLADPGGVSNWNGQPSPSSSDTFKRMGTLVTLFFSIRPAWLGDQFFHAAQVADREAELSSLYNM